MGRYTRNLWHIRSGYYNNSNLEENDNHYIRIQKSFLGNLAASQMAQEIDSIYYNPNDIVLSIDKLQNGVIVETFDLELVNNLDKLDGYFANESHQLYKFNSLTDNGQPSYDFQINFTILKLVRNYHHLLVLFNLSE